jgi:hypothetical protein
MQRALIASGVLGLGTALVFGAAALTASLFPNGSAVAASFNGGDMMFAKPGMGAMPVPMPAQPVFAQPGVVVGGGGQGVAPDIAPAPTVEPGPTD